MPYVKQTDRIALDPYIERLADVILARKDTNGYEGVAGLLNYCVTRLGLALITNIGRRYWAIALVIGVYRTAADEFYRRVAVPYEEEKRKEYGDVYTT